MRIAIIATTALMLLATFAAAQEVGYDFSKGADFSHYKTYALISGHPVGDEFADSRIVSSIDAQLSAKGLTRVSADENPDLLVSYDVTLDQDVRGRGFKDGLRTMRWSSGGKYVVTGMLMVSLVEANTDLLVWRAMASGNVDPNASEEKRDKNINKVAQMIFRYYPPQE